MRRAVRQDRMTGMEINGIDGKRWTFRSAGNPEGPPASHDTRRLHHRSRAPWECPRNRHGSPASGTVRKHLGAIGKPRTGTESQSELFTHRQTG